jgi:hypothetical protein
VQNPQGDCIGRCIRQHGVSLHHCRQRRRKPITIHRLKPRQWVHYVDSTALPVIIVVVGVEAKLATFLCNRTVENVRAHAQTLRRFGTSRLINNGIKCGEPLDLDD